MMMLDNTKRHIFVNKLNFLGFSREFSEDRKSLKSIRFVGIYENKFMNMDVPGLLPSFGWFLRWRNKR